MSIKWFCDWCDKEIENHLTAIHVSVVSGWTVCKECGLKEADWIEDNLVKKKENSND